MYIHENNEWPSFKWRESELADRLAHVRHQQGRLVGKMESLGFDLRQEATLYTLTEDVIKSSEIEGEDLDKYQVRSSVARRLGMDIAGLVPTERYVEGVVEMMLDATQNYQKKLTSDRLFGWHAALFPTGYSGLSKIIVANWRKDTEGSMQVVSGPIGKERVHYEAPVAKLVSAEMGQFIGWFNLPPSSDLVLCAAISHLWFVTVHPFEDGNGRIARAITDMVLSRSEQSAQRFYSMSSQIRKERNAYYNILEVTQKGDLDITGWLLWFLECLEHAIIGADETLSNVLDKAAFWQMHKNSVLNERQVRVLNRLLEDFEGHLTSSKWAKLTKSSQDTALRDINDLVKKGVLQKGMSSGRSTHYVIKSLIS